MREMRWRIVLYNVLLAVTVVVAAPWIAYQLLAVSRRKEGISQRLGNSPANPGSPVWFHAVSVGEVRAVTPVMEELAKRLKNASRMVLSTVTVTGQETARRECLFAENIFYFPLDFPLAVSRAFARIGPSMFITAETEFWPNFLFGCFKRGVPVVVVNGRISDRSFSRYMRFRWFFHPFLRGVSLFLMQSDEDARRILAMGAAEESVEVTGNTKYDVKPVPAELPVEVRNWAESSFLLVAGSTHGGEEEIILNALEMTGLSDVRLAVVPRHPERFDEVAGLLLDRNIPFVRLSGLTAGRRISEKVLLVDAMGVLDAFYSVAGAAFVGGSLVPVGGHNLLEPAMYGVPVLTGPNLQNFRDIADALIESGGCRIVEDGDSLANALRSLKDNWQEWERMGNAAKSVFARRTGAARRDVDAILPYIGGSPSNPGNHRFEDKGQG